MFPAKKISLVFRNTTEYRYVNISIKLRLTLVLPHTIQIGPSVIKVRRPFFNLSQLLRYTQNLIFSAKIRKLIVWAFFHDVLSKMAREKISLDSSCYSRRKVPKNPELCGWQEWPGCQCGVKSQSQPIKPFVLRLASVK